MRLHMGDLRGPACARAGKSHPGGLRFESDKRHSPTSRSEAGSGGGDRKLQSWACLPHTSDLLVALSVIATLTVR